MNVLGGVRFFPMPQELVLSGALRGFSGSAIKLYCFLFFLAQKHSATRIQTVGYEIRDFTGMHENSASRARNELVASNLVTCRKLQWNIDEYQLLDPIAKLPLEPPVGKDGKKRLGIRVWKPSSGRNAKSSRMNRPKKPKPIQVKPTYPLSWDDLEASPEREPGEDWLQ